MKSQLRTAILPAALVLLMSAPVVRAQGRSSLVPSSTVAQLGLERAWAMQLRVDPLRGRVGSLHMSQGILLAHTTLGTVQAIDPETGRTLWTTSVGKPDYETMAPAANDKFVAVVNGTKLYMLDRKTGAQLWEQRIGGSPAAGLAMNAELAFVPLDTGIVEAYKLVRTRRLDEIPDRYSGSEGAVAAPEVTGNRVIWAVSRGYVYSRQAGEELVQFRYQMDDDASVSPAHMAPYVYAASRKGTVYCLSETNGVRIWDFAAGNSVSHPIMTIDGALYVVTEKGDMYRLDPKTGVPMWSQRGVSRLASAGSGKLYATDRYGRLAVFDAATGTRLGAVPIGETDIVVPNSETDRIYLATATGQVQAFHESALAKPLAHTPGFAIPPPVKPGAAPAEGAAPADGAAPAATTPADPAAAAPNNPFGT
jgi:outer membrane protein assembly factor BamB